MFLPRALRRDNDLENALLMQLTHQFLSLEMKMRNFMHETDRTDQGVHTNILWIDSDENGKANHRYFRSCIFSSAPKLLFQGRRFDAGPRHGNTFNSTQSR